MTHTPFHPLIEDTSGLSQGIPLDSELLASIAISLKRLADMHEQLCRHLILGKPK